jgi:zinc protease
LLTTYTLDPIQDGERSVVLRRLGGVPLIGAAYHTPPAAHPDFSALELINIIMGDTPSGRLHKRLVEPRLAASSYAFSQGLFDPGFTLFGVQLSLDQDIDKATAILQNTLESVGQEPFTGEEFQRAKLKWLNSWEQGFTNAQAVGVSLSESVAQGDWRLFFLGRDRVRQLKLADVQRVAQERLLPSNRTLGMYLPTDKPVRAPQPAAVDIPAQIQTFLPQAAASAALAFDATPANIDRLTQRSRVVSTALGKDHDQAVRPEPAPSGMQVALLPKGGRGQAVHAVLTLHFGDEKSLFGQNDIPYFVASLLDKGTLKLSRQQVQDQLDALQTELSIKGEGTSVVVSIVTRRAHIAAAIALVADMLQHPSLPADVLQEIKDQALATLEQQRKEPGGLAENTLERLGNPYPKGDVRHSRTFDEQAQDIRDVTADQVAAFHRRFYSARHAEFAVAGDFDLEQVQSALQTEFGHWQSGESYSRIAEPLVTVPGQRVVLATPDKQNATLLVRLSVPLSDLDADYPALTMANYILGAGGSSRLWKRIRETEGLSYDVHSRLQWSSQERHSQWLASVIFAPQNLGKVERAFKQELNRALAYGFTQSELTQAKAGLLAFRRLSRSQDGNLAGALANNLHLGRTFAVSAKVDAALSQLSLEQVNAALRRYVVPASLVTVVAGDFKE